MTDREKEIFETVISDIKNFQEKCNNSEIVRFLEYIIILGAELNYSDKFMKRIHFLRCYYNTGDIKINEKI